MSTRLAHDKQWTHMDLIGNDSHRKCYNFAGGARVYPHPELLSDQCKYSLFSNQHMRPHRASHICEREMRHLQMQTNLECNLMQTRQGRGEWRWRQPKNNSRTAAPDAARIGVRQLFGISVCTYNIFGGFEWLICIQNMIKLALLY